MMLDADIVAVSPSSVYRVLKAAASWLPEVGNRPGRDKASSSPCGLDPSADPGAKTGVGGTMPPLGIPGFTGKR